MVYDLIILGAGPGGLAASIYASYHKLNHLIVGESIGGTALEAAHVRNYPGLKTISGVELMSKFKEHAEELGGKIFQAGIIGLKKENDIFKVVTTKESFEGKSLLIALGTQRRKLNIIGEKKLLGKGVSYCATCDAIFFKNKIVSVTGGGNSAAMAAMLLAEHASRVYLIYRGKELRCTPSTIDQLTSNPKIIIIYNTAVLEIKGDNKVESILLNNAFQNSETLKVDGIFVEIGSTPSTNLLNELGVKLNEDGYINVDQWGATNIPGVYGAGDIISNTPGFNQIITASADGATAVSAIYKYLKENKK